MTNSVAIVSSNQTDASYLPSLSPEGIGSRQLSEAYGTILALQLKLEAASRDLARLCEIRETPATVSENRIECLLESAISDRARRATILPARLFADPAWDMLLELFLAELRQYRVSVSNLCIASQCPATTGLRWIGFLESEGLVIREADPFDRRRYYVRLTDTGSKAMRAYFSTGLEVALERSAA